MHSQLALTEHASLNLAPLILLDPVRIINDGILTPLRLPLRTEPWMASKKAIWALLFSLAAFSINYGGMNVEIRYG